MQPLSFAILSDDIDKWTLFCLYRITPVQRDEIKKWCTDNFGRIASRRYDYDNYIWDMEYEAMSMYTISFKHDEDAILFKMTWC